MRGSLNASADLPGTRGLDRFVPAAVLEHAGPEGRWRLHLTLVLGPLCALIGVVGALVAATHGEMQSARISLAAAALWALSVPALWITRSARVAATCLPLGLFLDLAGQAVLVWEQPLALVFLFVAPMAAVLLMGSRAGLVWSGILVLSSWPLAVVQAQRIGAEAQSPLATAWVTSAFAATIVAGLLVSETLRVRALQQAERARRRAEEASRNLATEQTRFRAISEGSFQTLVETDRNGIVLYANPRFEEVLGYRPEELIGKHPSVTLADPGLDVDPSRPVAELIAPGARYEVANRHRAGHVVWQEVAASRYWTLEGEERWIFAGRDITREKAERERLLEAQKLESLGVLAGGVAHDFNNLLTVITGYAEELPEGEPAREIRTAARRASALTAQLLAFGRKQVRQIQVTTLDALVVDLENVLRSLVREEVQLELDLQSAPWRVEVDPNQLQQVLVNLATNARDAMPHGGSLCVATTRVELGPEEARAIGVASGAFVRLSVTDTGVGMSAQTRDRALEPFFTTKAAGFGTGLGLASVYGIIEQSHGGLQIRTAPGRGTEIRVYLPRSERAPSRSPVRAQPAALSSRGSVRAANILLVEDEDSVRRLVKESLQRAGHRVRVASSGAEGLAQSRDPVAPIDLLVTDVIMPGMRGPELVAKLRADRPKLRVLLVSGYDEGQMGVEGASDGWTRFLAKPFTPQQLLQVVAELLEGRPAA